MPLGVPATPVPSTDPANSPVPLTTQDAQHRTERKQETTGKSSVADLARQIKVLCDTVLGPGNYPPPT
jgi:hypothetical protein